MLVFVIGGVCVACIDFVNVVEAVWVLLGAGDFVLVIVVFIEGLC